MILALAVTAVALLALVALFALACVGWLMRIAEALEARMPKMGSSSKPAEQNGPVGPGDQVTLMTGKLR